MPSHAKLFFQPIVNLVCLKIRFYFFEFYLSFENQVVSSYDDIPHSCFLYLISIIVDEYGNDQELRLPIMIMSEHLTNKTFSIINNQDGFKQNPDLVDDFYRLSSR